MTQSGDSRGGRADGEVGLQYGALPDDMNGEMPRIAIASVVALMVGAAAVLELERRIYRLAKSAWA